MPLRMQAYLVLLQEKKTIGSTQGGKKKKHRLNRLGAALCGKTAAESIFHHWTLSGWIRAGLQVCLTVISDV